MFKKCDANCDAKVPHLWLRNNIFYYSKRCYVIFIDKTNECSYNNAVSC